MYILKLCIVDITERTLVGGLFSFRNMTIASIATRFGNGTDIDVNGSNVTDS